MYLRLFFSLLFASSFLGALEWSAPITLSNPAQNSKNPVLSVDYATGHAIAAWVAQSGGHAVIDASIFDGDSWSEPTTISDSESNSDQPSVSINQDGHALVIWRSALTTTTNGISASFFNGMAWSVPASIGATPTSDTPQVALHPMLDTALAVWKKSRGIAGLQTAFFDGMDWTLVPGFEPSSVIGKFKLCMNLAGTALLNWIQVASNSPLQTAVFGAVFEGGWSTATQLSLTGETPINTDAAIYLNADRGGALWTNLTSIRSSYWDDLQWLNAEIAANSLSSAIYPKLTFSPLFRIWPGYGKAPKGFKEPST